EHDLDGQDHLTGADEPPVPPPRLAVGAADPAEDPRGRRPEPQQAEQRDHDVADELVDLRHRATAPWVRTPRSDRPPAVRPRSCSAAWRGAAPPWRTRPRTPQRRATPPRCPVGRGAWRARGDRRTGRGTPTGP